MSIGFCALCTALTIFGVGCLALRDLIIHKQEIQRDNLHKIEVLNKKRFDSIATEIEKL